MKKSFVITLLIVSIMAIPVLANETEDRIAALEAKVIELEARISALEGNDAEKIETQDENSEMTTTDSITLTTGTWIVGEDLPAGKYNLASPDGESHIKMYDNYDARKAREYSYFEDYTLVNQEYLDSVINMFGESYINTISGLYTVQANNVRLEDNNCIYIEGPGVLFTPAQ